MFVIALVFSGSVLSAPNGMKEFDLSSYVGMRSARHADSGNKPLQPTSRVSLETGNIDSHFAGSAVK
jgi:hypothetical protein